MSLAWCILSNTLLTSFFIIKKKSPFTKSVCKYIHTASTAVLLLRWSLQNFSICTGCWWKLLGKKIIYFFKQVSGHPCFGTLFSSPCVCLVQSLVGTIGVNTSYPVSIGNVDRPCKRFVFEALIVSSPTFYKLVRLLRYFGDLRAGLTK